ncbi:MAG TPA: hypothetical protein VF614_07555 [Chthoniobacteraceae bacterium]
MNLDQLTGRLAERYGVSEEAVETLRSALERGGGRLAQFSHPELGGYGQWMPRHDAGWRHVQSRPPRSGGTDLPGTL